NSAFGYLDPVRQRPTLAIRGGMLADRLIVESGRVRAVEVIGPEGPARIEAGEVVVCAGAYGSPALLLRSGIGPPEPLRALGIDPVHPLPEWGRTCTTTPPSCSPTAARRRSSRHSRPSSTVVARSARRGRSPRGAARGASAPSTCTSTRWPAPT